MRRKIIVRYTCYGMRGKSAYKLFTDWYDFADWVKQLNKDGRPVCIFEWRYDNA